MAMLIRITGPKHKENKHIKPENNAGLEETSMEDLIHQIFAEENITQDTWNTSRNGNFFVVEFPALDQNFSERILDRLGYFNVGKTPDSSIMIIEPAAVVHKKDKEPRRGTSDIPVKHFQKFVSSLKSRLTVAQVYHAISNQGNFNFNYLSFLICAAVVADIALVTNSAASVFASMLLSPLMEPIMCIIFGLSLREKRMTKKGLRNTAISLVICICVGLTFGIAAHYISIFQDTVPYPTNEMMGRGYAKSLIASVVVAAASGVSISFAVLSNSLAAMIGNAISLSLLPPAVNCGQFFLLSVLALLDRPYVMKTTMALEASKNTTQMYCDYWWIQKYNLVYVDNLCEAPKEFALLGTVSFCLTLLNIVLIIITGYSVNWLKDLVPKSFTNEETRIFYTKDLKEVRDNYKCVHKLEATDLASQAYREYLRLSKVYPENGDHLALTEEENEQLTKDFQAVMEGIGKDRHLQNISTWTSKGEDPFMSNFQRATENLVERRGSRKSFAVSLDGEASIPPSDDHTRQKSLPVSRLEADFRTVQSRVNPIPTTSDTTLGGSAASKRLEKLKRLAEVESAHSMEEEEENEGVMEAPVQQGLRKASVYPVLFLRNAFPRNQRLMQMRKSIAGHLGQDRRMSRLENHGNDVQQHRQSVAPRDVTIVDGSSRPQKAGTGDRGHSRDRTDDSRRPGGTGKYPSPGDPKYDALSTISSADSHRSSEVPPSTRGTGARKPPISQSAYDLPSQAEKFRKSSSISSVSTIGKFEVTPAIDIEPKIRDLGKQRKGQS
uniref:Uncharacterized protein MJ0678 n=1 Tax=Schistocephalus solidus TaxID=70667 RepID=A0A0X3PJD2_SCHSO